MRIKAAHRLPRSGREQAAAFWLLGTVAAVGTLIWEYQPETRFAPDTNVLLENAAIAIMALSNAIEALTAVARPETEDVPLENLRGWLFAFYWLGGVFLFLNFGLLDLYTWLTNREHVTIIMDDESLVVRHSAFRSKSVARSAVEQVLILPNHRTGYDVMLQHEDGLIRVASVYGDQTRPTLIKLRLEQALAQTGHCADEREKSAA
ncbi:hypothetical protein [Roseovarius sp. MBR-6]|uniref:hypothetical protein n=1 Tax=Roseovarius sp. MBR-6 TaxID=3156459 RepID=UPI0033989F65